MNKLINHNISFDSQWITSFEQELAPRIGSNVLHASKKGLVKISPWSDFICFIPSIAGVNTVSSISYQNALFTIENSKSQKQKLENVTWTLKYNLQLFFSCQFHINQLTESYQKRENVAENEHEGSNQRD